jgi:hypothetical protein
MSQTVTAFTEVSLEAFIAGIVPRNQPAVLKDIARDWPAVRAARTSDEAMSAYLSGLDRGALVETFVGAPEIAGRFFYTNDLKSTNFERQPRGIADTLIALLALRAEPDPAALYIQSAPTRDCLPGFAEANFIPFMPRDIAARIWIGNALRVQTHYDLSNNIAVCVAGRRRFCLFPPEQLPNLYMGPLENTLAGPPVSMVDLEAPDLARYPRFAEAQKVMQTAELAPGDAIYIPYGWWHDVRSLTPFNVLVNYWWNDTEAGLGSPYDALLDAMLTIRDLPRSQRDVWKIFFDTYVFHAHGDPTAHLPPGSAGPLGPLSPQGRLRYRQQLVQNLMRGLK